MKCVVGVFVLFFVFYGNTENKLFWPERHGPNLNGVVPEPQNSKLPIEWDAQKNIAWKISLKGKGHSSPVIMGSQIWLTSATVDGREMYAYCIDRDSGKIIHHITVFKMPILSLLGLGRKIILMQLQHAS